MFLEEFVNVLKIVLVSNSFKNLSSLKSLKKQQLYNQIKISLVK